MHPARMDRHSQLLATARVGKGLADKRGYFTAASYRALHGDWERTGSADLI
jgi:hypothetical protein